MPASPGSSLPPRWLRAMISFRSSDELTSSNSARGSTPISLRIPFEAEFNSQISGLKTRRNSSRGRATRIAVFSELTIE
jgi:hypothetical protein